MYTLSYQIFAAYQETNLEKMNCNARNRTLFPLSKRMDSDSYSSESDEYLDYTDEPGTIYIHVWIYLAPDMTKTRTIISKLDLFGYKLLDIKKISRDMARAFGCGRVLSTGYSKSILISLQGDQRDNVKKYLIKNKIVPEERIKIHKCSQPIYDAPCSYHNKLPPSCH